MPLILLSRPRPVRVDVTLLCLSLAGACHPPGGNDPGPGGSPPSPATRPDAAPGASAAPALVPAASTPLPPPALLGTTCSLLERAGLGAAASLLGAGHERAELVAADGSRGGLAAGQCLAGQRLERLVTVDPVACTYLEVTALPPVERIEVEVEASLAAALPGAKWSVARPEGSTRLPPAGCFAARPERPVIVRLVATVVEGGGVVAVRVASAPAR